MTPDTADRVATDGVPATAGGRTWALALLPLILLAALLAVIVWSGPADAIRGDGVPPVERLTFQRVLLQDDGIVATVLNDGPDPVTIAQVQVDEAYWTFTADGSLELDHLGRTTLRIPYPWVEGEAHIVKVLTSTGTPFEHEIPVAVATPEPSLRFLGVFTLIGLYVGVLPVAIGLLWYPFLARLSSRGMDFLLALTIGLLMFLLIDGTHEGFEAAAMLPESFQGAVLFALAAAGTYLLLETVGAWLRGRRSAAPGDETRGWVLALLIAVGIGLHNFGEGLARARTAVSIGALLRLGLIGGVPTIAGAWLGGFVYSPVWAVLFLAMGVGAIAQVVLQITRQVAGSQPVSRQLAQGPVLAGLFAGFAVMYITGMLVG